MVERDLTARFGEVVEASVERLIGQCHQLYEAPPLGALVRAGDGVFGVVSGIATSALDPSRRVIARGHDAASEAEVYAAVEVFGGVAIFAEYERDLDGFHIDEQENRRIFHEIDRVTVGLRWITRFFDASFGVGHTLDHSYRVGFDLRDANTRADLTDEFYLTFVLQGTL